MKADDYLAANFDKIRLLHRGKVSEIYPKPLQIDPHDPWR